jgi:hypothetical protein
MVRRKDLFLAELALACDIIVVAAAYFAAYSLLAWWRHDSRPGLIRPFADYAWILWVIGPVWVFAHGMRSCTVPLASFPSEGCSKRC